MTVRNSGAAVEVERNSQVSRPRPQARAACAYLRSSSWSVKVLSRGGGEHAAFRSCLRDRQLVGISLPRGAALVLDPWPRTSPHAHRSLEAGIWAARKYSGTMRSAIGWPIASASPFRTGLRRRVERSPPADRRDDPSARSRRWRLDWFQVPAFGHVPSLDVSPSCTVFPHCAKKLCCPVQ